MIDTLLSVLAALMTFQQLAYMVLGVGPRLGRIAGLSLLVLRGIPGSSARLATVLDGFTLAKRRAAAAIGLLIGFMGAAPDTGEFRMIFGTEYLYDGVPLAIIGLGLFALPEISDLLRKNSTIAEGNALASGGLRGLRDWCANLFLSIRCAGFGCMIGAIPGLGGSVVDWIAYGHAAHIAKDNPHFGKGDIRGVIAPESANNAM